MYSESRLYSFRWTIFAVFIDSASRRVHVIIDDSPAPRGPYQLMRRMPQRPSLNATKRIVIVPFLANTLVCLLVTYRHEHKAQLIIGSPSRCQS